MHSLCDLIKQEYAKKNRTLKIVTDFDECLFSRKATAYHIYYQELSSKQVPFADFFKEFWSKAEFEYQGYISITQTSGIDLIEEERKNDPEKMKYTETKICREKEDLYDYAPPLTFTADLITALKEGLISEIVVHGNDSPWHKRTQGKHKLQSSQDESVVGDHRKRRILQRTLGKFPQVKMRINVEKLSRAEFTAKEDPNFDIFIDDNPITAQGVADLFPNKPVVMPDYYYKIPLRRVNIYNIYNSVSNLRDEDFVYQGKQQPQIFSQTQNPERERNI